MLTLPLDTPSGTDASTSSTTVWSWLLGVPLKIALIIVVGGIVVAFLRWLIKRWVASVVNEVPVVRRGPFKKIADTKMAEAISGISPLLSSRRKQRTRALGSVLRSVVSIVVWSIVFLMVLSELNINVAPLLASAGVAGVALGFGAQSLVKDFISGIFLMAEDQYGVGDVVNLGPASGTVEAVGLRVTKVRDGDGTLWYVRNGEIARVGNMTQGWSKAVVAVRVSYSETIETVESLLKEIGAGLRKDDAHSKDVLDAGTVTGLDDLSAEAMVLTLSVKTAPGRQWEIQRELRRRVHHEFRERHVTLA